MKLSKCYPKCPKTFKDCIPSKAAIQNVQFPYAKRDKLYTATDNIRKVKE